MNIYIYFGYGTLKVKGTQHGFCVQVAFKNARTIIIFEVMQGGQQFSVKNLEYDGVMACKSGAHVIWHEL